MTPTAALLARIGWTASEAARRLGRSETVVRGWVHDRSTRGNPSAPPPPVLAWLAALADAIDRNPPPR